MSNAGRAKKILAAASFALLLALALCPMAQAYDDDTVIRVGLSYSRGAQPAFNALADKGYIIGYFEGDEFYEVGTLSNRYVAFCTDTMLYTSGPHRDLFVFGRGHRVQALPSGGRARLRQH